MNVQISDMAMRVREAIEGLRLEWLTDVNVEERVTWLLHEAANAAMAACWDSVGGMAHHGESVTVTLS